MANHHHANHHRGEISAQLGGKSYVLCLTLQGLSELEALFEVSDLLSLVQRLEAGKFSARQITAILGVGLRCAGEQISDQEVSALSSDTGVTGYIETVSRLLQATFGSGQPASPQQGRSASGNLTGKK